MRFWIPVFLALLSTAVHAGDFTLSSPSFKEGDRLSETNEYNGFGCNGDNISPALKWSGAPAGTKSFAVTVYDPDAPTGSGWWHWLIYNIPANTEGLPRNAGDMEAGRAPEGSVQSRTDYNTRGYGGMCPPAGDQPHHYIFTVYALDVPSLDVPPDSPPAIVGFNIQQHKLGEAKLVGLYSRK